METVRYTPAEVVRWLDVGAESNRASAKRQTRSIVRREGERTIGKDIMQAAGAIFDAGKSAYAELMRRQTEGTEYVLLEEAFEVRSLGRVRTVRYDEVQDISMRTADRVVLALERGSISIKPVAHLVAGRLRVPIGWNRNGMEVPYAILVEELAARCGLEVAHQ
jgi:hypothetical protein